MSTAKSLVDDLVAVLSVDIEGLSSSERFIYATLIVGHLVSHVYETESRDGTDAERVQLKKDIIEVVHELLGKLDIPYVPDYMEAMVKSLIEQPLATGLDEIGKKFAEVRGKVEDVVKKARAK